MRASPVILAASLLALAALSSRAHAGGIELLPGGTQAVARGGAVAARPENAMLILQNPAGLALLEDGQFLLNFDLALHSMCVDRYGYYGWNVGSDMHDTEFGPQSTDPSQLSAKQKANDYGLTPLPKVCNSAPNFAQPALAWVGKIGDNLALAGGFLGATVVPGLQFGGADGTIDTPQGSRPTPTRYELIRQQLKFGLPPTFAAAYRFAPQLQIGASVTILMLRAVARAMVNAASTTAPYNDWLIDVDAHDYFVPSGVVSVNSKPIPELDVMAALHWADSFRGSGNVKFITNYFQTGMTAGPIPTRNGPFKLSQVQVGFPWAVAFAARYAGLLKRGEEAPKNGQRSLGDPLDRELWDVEFDATYSLATMAGANKVRAGEDLTVVTRNAGGNGDIQKVDQSVGSSDVDRRLKNSLAVRVGGSYSIVPREIAIEAGAFYETRGVDPAYVSIDNFAFARVGVGVGAMFRIGDFDLLAAYSHIFQETVEVAPPPDSKDFSQRVGFTRNADGTIGNGKVMADPAAPSASSADAVAAFRPAQPNADTPRKSPIINAGKYTASFNILSAGLIYHF